MPHLLSEDLDIDSFLDLLEKHSWPEDALIMAFTPAESRFGRFAFDAPFIIRTEQGRIFSPAGELRWRPIEGKIRTVYLGTEPPSSILTDFSWELEEFTPRQRELLLWGERTDSLPVWLEQSAPHRFNYPIYTANHPRGRVALVIEEWIDHAGIPQFARYHGIKEIQGGNHAAG